ncbi:MAG: RNA-binding protein [Hyphomicrobiaceae bacterium]|nr:RNA-binding protein [Hyphomicrobiaceae bacterium]
MDETSVTTNKRDDDSAPHPRRGKGRAGVVARLCIVNRIELPVEQMFRFVVGPDGMLVPDLAHRLPGRGVWVDGRRDDVLTAVKKGLFKRSLKRPVTVDPEICATIERLLVADVRQALSLANKAGLVASGFGKVDAELAGGRVAVLLQAQEARPDGAQKLARKFIAIARDRGKPSPIVDELSSADLSLAIGGENVIHAAMAAGGQSRSFMRRVLRLKRFRMMSIDEAAGEAAKASGTSPEGEAVANTEHIGTDRE